MFNTARTVRGAGSSGVGLKYEGVAFYAVTPDAQQRCPSAFPIAIARYFVAGASPHHEYPIMNPKMRMPRLERVER